MSKIKECNINHIEGFVDSLKDDQARVLCKYLSHQRKNRVYDFISKGPDHWKMSDISISNIYVEKVNPTVNNYLERNDWSLEKISMDKDIHHLDEFKSQGPINTKLLSFIAKKIGNDYKIVDGIHRVIRLSCDGEKTFKLIYYRDI